MRWEAEARSITALLQEVGEGWLSSFPGSVRLALGCDGREALSGVGGLQTRWDPASG